MMYVSAEIFNIGGIEHKLLCDIDVNHCEVVDVDSGEIIRCIWADDSTGEYCQYVRKDGKVQSVSVCGRRPIPKKQICYGNIRIIDARKEKLVDGKIVPV